MGMASAVRFAVATMVINAAYHGVSLPARSLSEVKFLVIHRIDVGETSQQIADFFQRKEPQWTGGKQPYHFVIFRDGRVEQMAPLHHIAQGAIALNPQGLQIAVVGDFRIKAPTLEQNASLTELAALLCTFLGKVNIVGHSDDMANVRFDPAHICPGRHLNMDELRANVTKRCAEIGDPQGLFRLAAQGIVF